MGAWDAERTADLRTLAKPRFIADVLPDCGGFENCEGLVYSGDRGGMVDSISDMPFMVSSADLMAAARPSSIVGRKTKDVFSMSELTRSVKP